MKNFIIFNFITYLSAFARQFLLSALFITSLATISFGQQNNLAQTQYAKAKIDISHLAALEDKADEVVEVAIDRKTLRLAEKFFGKSTDPDEIKIKELIGGIEGIWVRVFEFEKENGYAASDYENIRSQMQGNGWTKLVGVRSKKKDSTKVEVSLMTDDNDNILGVAIIAAEPNQLAVVNIVGTFDPARIRELSGKFKIPDLELEGLGMVKKKNKDKSDESKDDKKDEIKEVKKQDS